MSLKKFTAIVVSLVILVGCGRSDSGSPAAAPNLIDTTVEIVNDKGEVVETVEPTTPQAPVQQKTRVEQLKELWATTSFNKVMLKGVFMGVDICVLSEKHFVGCFFAAREMSEIINGSDTILLVPALAQSQGAGAEVKKLRLFGVYKKATPPVLAPGDAVGGANLLRLNSENDEATIKALLQIYKEQVAGHPQVLIVKEKIKALSQLMGTVKKTVPAAKAMVVQAMEKANTELEAATAALEKDVMSDLVQILDEAFDKIPEAEQNYQAGDIYSTYLRYSADGHASLRLGPILEQRLKSTQDNFFGIGVGIKEFKGAIYVDPMANSAAAAAGMKRNDKIIKAAGQEIGNSLEKAVALIRGPKDSTVEITWQSAETGEKITRAVSRLPVQSKSYTFSTDSSGKAGVVDIRSFMDPGMAAAVRKYVQENDTKVQAWVVDLRNNGGGLLDQAVDLASIFLPQGTVVVGTSKDDDLDTMDPSKNLKTKGSQATKKDLIVLINAGSASASEVVSGSLQEHKRAVILGETSFGKGSVQSGPQSDHPDIPNYDIWDAQFSTMAVGPKGFQQVPVLMFMKTTSRYFFPSGRTPEWVGVEPDVKVFADPEGTEVFIPRERHLIPFSMPNVGIAWTQTRGKLVNGIQACVKSVGKSAETFKKVSMDAFHETYQMLYAIDALGCMAGPELATLK